MKIGKLFLADVERDINPVIKVADQDQAELRSELEDYVVTDVIEKYLDDFLEHYTDTRQKATDKIGVWTSGYVGSGKSHFAKILGLLTRNPTVEGRSAIDWFRPRIATCRNARDLSNHLFEVETYLHTEVIAFQINSVAIKGTADDVCSILYRQFLAHRGLSTDLKIATLIEEPLLERNADDTFRRIVRELAGKPWDEVRARPMLYWDEIFGALAQTLPDRFRDAAAAQEAFDRTTVQPTFQQLAKDLTAYAATLQERQRDREVRLLFIVDELGQFVADDGERLLDVQSFAEEVATYGKGKVWIVVTSHESMHDIVKNARQFKGDLKKLEGRFHKRYALTTENIEQVLEERLFKKSKAGEDELSDTYRRRGGTIKDVGELVKVDRTMPPCDADRFIACYPFLPYQLILIPDLLHGLRVAGGRGEALTGAARSLLGITQGVMKHQSYPSSEIGRLVPLDEVYAEIEDAEIPSDVRRELNGVDQRVTDPAFPLKRILRALYLLQQVTYAPRTLDNLARLLVGGVDVDFAALRSQVEAGLGQLIAARYVAQTGEQYEYLSGERKRIEEEIAEEEVRTAQKRDELKKHFTAVNLEVGTVRYEDAYRFDVRVVCDDQVVISKGGIEVRMISPLKSLLDGVRADDLEGESLGTPNTLYWLARPSSEIERTLDRIVRLERVVARYEADPTKSAEMADIVKGKRRDLEERLKPELIAELKAGFRQGQFIFRGNAHTGDPRLDRMGRLFSAEVAAIIPKVYVQFQKAKHVVADERKAIEAILTGPASRLAQVEPPLGLFDKQGGLNRASRALDDVYNYLDGESRRGSVVTGKSLSERYEGIPYGWDSNVARLCAAALFRAGALLVTVDKKDFRDPRDPDIQRIFSDSRRFERAELRLESDVELSVDERMRAREQLNVLFGVRPEETPAALAEALQKQLRDRLDALRELGEWMRLTAFPAPTAFATAAASFARLVEERRPNTAVRDFLAQLADVAAQVRTVDALREFFTSPRRDEYERGKTLVAGLRAAQGEGLATEAMARAVTEYDGRVRDRELLDRWGEVQGLLLAAVNDLRSLYAAKHREADDAYRGLSERLENYSRGLGVLTDDAASKLIGSVRAQVCPGLTGWTPESGFRCAACQRDLVTLVNAPLGAQRREEWLIRQIELRAAAAAPAPARGSADGKATGETNGSVQTARRVRVIQLQTILTNRRFHLASEWDTFRNQLDGQVKKALSDGDDVELR